MMIVTCFTLSLGPETVVSDWLVPSATRNHPKNLRTRDLNQNTYRSKHRHLPISVTTLYRSPQCAYSGWHFHSVELT